MKIGVAVVVYLVCSIFVSARSPAPQSKELLEVYAIVDDPHLSGPQKVEHLRAYVGKLESLEYLLGCMWRCDTLAAPKLALELFRNKNTPVDQKLQCGRYLLTRCETPKHFMDEYAPFLIATALQSADEFMKGRECYHSAIGQITFTATDFEGHKESDFEKLNDKRLIPVLIRCLDAQDYGADPRSREPNNMERRGIPIALAKLGAVEAAPKLAQILEKSRDYWFRFYCAQALGYMLPHQESLKIEQLLLGLTDEDAKFLYFGFGTGLVERGDPLGVRYLSFKYSSYYNNGQAALYMLDERLEILKKAKVQDRAALTAFYSESLNYPPLRLVLEQDPSKLNFGSAANPNDSPEKRKHDIEKAVAEYLAGVIDDYNWILGDLKRHHLTGLSDTIRNIAEKTKSPEIRAVSQQWLHEMR